MKTEGFTDFKASKLPKAEQGRLRRALQHDLVEAMVRAIQQNPPDVDLSDIELVLRPGVNLENFDVAADCGTCGTCGTGGGCGTCGTS
jgi:hypothetical protein